MRAAAALALLLLALAAVGPGGIASAQYDTPQQEEPAQTAPSEQPQTSGGDGGDDSSGPPIWAGIGLILLAAVAGTLAARARNRRRMRDYQGD
jgi:hypothetical protein